jgi:hypothetical protein
MQVRQDGEDRLWRLVEPYEHPSESLEGLEQSSERLKESSQRLEQASEQLAILAERRSELAAALDQSFHVLFRDRIGTSEGKEDL